MKTNAQREILPTMEQSSFFLYLTILFMFGLCWQRPVIASQYLQKVCYAQELSIGIFIQQGLTK